MPKKIDYQNKFEKISAKTLFGVLKKVDRDFIKEKSHQYRLTFQELKIISEIALDLRMWEENSIEKMWNNIFKNQNENIDLPKDKVFKLLTSKWNSLKREKKDYSLFQANDCRSTKYTTVPQKENAKILGKCPVASENTRCCNLLTLDTIRNCALDCSYCSLQSFNNSDKIFIEENLSEKLEKLNLDPKKYYHIGTGQASDSLALGNKNHILESLLKFAEENPNIILELKTKSKNIDFLLNNDIPKNIICTWSLNSNTIINCEERLTSSLKERLDAARLLANKNILVGFHFHPLIFYKGFEEDYQNIASEIQKLFTPEEIVMISMGTVTFTRNVVGKIRQRNFNTKIHQMPLVESGGKLSYPQEIKLELFSNVYRAFDDWHKKVFFYLCMEEKSLWEPIFGYHYQTNQKFEESMICSYLSKIYK